MAYSDILYIVIPCYNEEAVLPETVKRLTLKLDTMISDSLISKDSKIALIDDGSRDNTWQMICDFHKDNSYIVGVKSSRNRGHQNTLLAGLMTVKSDCDITVSMDADLQDDIDVLDKFVREYEKGSQIVYGVRSSRKKDSFFKRFTAESFYRLMAAMGVEIVFNHADYRLMSKKALDALEDYREVNLFLRGIVPMVGFKTSVVEYERGERFAGESKYPLKKMLAFALDGITSCSIKPIRLVVLTGFIIFFLSILYLIYTIIGYFNGHTIAGWATIITSIWAIGGLELLAIGVIGEYIGKIYLETKHRPRYIIEEYLK